MNTSVKIFALFLVAYAEVGFPSTTRQESSLTACSSDNTACTYQHELLCPQHSTVSVVGGGQHFDFGVGHCFRQGFTCSHGCCTGCTIPMTPEESSSLRQQCDERQNCSYSVTRKFVTCGVLNEHPFYSGKSIIEYQCVQELTRPWTRDASEAVSQFPQSNSTTETQTSPSDVSEGVMTSFSEDTTVPIEVTSTTESWSLFNLTIDKGQVGVTDERGKTPATSAMAAVGGAAVGGAAAGAVTLLALSITLLLCWCRRRSKANAGEKVSRGAANPIYDISMDFLDDPVLPSAPQGEVTSAQSSSQSTAADTDYDHFGAKTARDVRPHDVTYGHLNDMDDEACYDRAGAKGKRDVISNVYDSARPVEMSEEDPYDVTTRSSRPDVVNDVYDVAGVPSGAGSDEENVLQDNGSSTGTKEPFEDTRSLEQEEVLESTYENF